jgi:hypothetical protein
MASYNLATKVEGNMLWIGIDLLAEHGDTSGGKGINVAKTGGYIPVPDTHGYAISLHLYKRKPKQPAPARGVLRSAPIQGKGL